MILPVNWSKGKLFCWELFLDIKLRLHKDLLEFFRQRIVPILILVQASRSCFIFNECVLRQDINRLICGTIAINPAFVFRYRIPFFSKPLLIFGQRVQRYVSVILFQLCNFRYNLYLWNFSLYLTWMVSHHDLAYIWNIQMSCFVLRGQNLSHSVRGNLSIGLVQLQRTLAWQFVLDFFVGFRVVNFLLILIMIYLIRILLELLCGLLPLTLQIRVCSAADRVGVLLKINLVTTYTLLLGARGLNLIATMMLVFFLFDNLHDESWVQIIFHFLLFMSLFSKVLLTVVFLSFWNYALQILVLILRTSDDFSDSAPEFIHRLFIRMLRGQFLVFLKLHIIFLQVFLVVLNSVNEI